MAKQTVSSTPNVSPSEYSAELALKYSHLNSQEYKKKYGQYMTPIEVAGFMSRLFSQNKNDTITVLDPGAGTGLLGCKVLEFFSNSNTPPKNIKFVVYEIDEKIIPYLEKILEYSKQWLKNKKINFTYQIKQEDFIVANADSFNDENVLFPIGNTLEKFDYIISNPPYFKLSKSDHRAQIASKIVHGQPNIYAIFMTVAALLLKDNGELVFITPRSFAAGPYFKTFREYFFSIVRPTYIHLFGSRKDAFNKEAVLQENIILKAIKDNTFDRQNAKVTISSSHGIKDIENTIKKSVSLQEIIDFESKNVVLRIPITNKEDQTVGLVHSWNKNLHSLGLNISTGPVVAFRATEYITSQGESNGHYHAPLLWMQNVKAMSIHWPTNCNKKQFIEDSQRTRRLLVPNKNYVVLRRFSAKEEDKRLVAAPYLSDSVKSETIGLENHLNYIYKSTGNLSSEETVGLAALLNSDLLDTYFRTSNGNTQVSATELRDMPLPPLETIIQIGKSIIKNNIENGEIDDLVQRSLANTQ